MDIRNRGQFEAKIMSLNISKCFRFQCYSFFLCGLVSLICCKDAFLPKPNDTIDPIALI